MYKPKLRFSLSEGFTLVELLVVISIIGVLSTLLLLQLNVARAKARDAKRVADINQVRSALELYFDDNGNYPATADLTLSLQNYLTKLPKDPGRNGCPVAYDGATTVAAGCYGYAWDPNIAPTKFHLWAELEQKATSALGNDLDANSTNGGANPLNFAGGHPVDGTNEVCVNSAAVDCVYDTGQVR